LARVKGEFRAFITVVFVVAIGVGLSSLTQRAPEVVDEPIKTGAISGPDIDSSYLCVNGVCTYYNRIPMVTATNTVCAIKSPNASTTLAAPPTSRLQLGSGPINFLKERRAVDSLAARRKPP
jgi:hypothetical protein